MLPEKMDILIKRGILKMNIDNLISMRENYPEKCKSFIIRNIQKYVEIMNQDIFSSTELMQLLEEKIDEELKIKLLQFETIPISIKNRKYSSGVQDYIVKNLYCEEDLEYLLQWYPENRIQLRNRILNIALEEIEEVLKVHCVLHTELLESLITSKGIDITHKKELLTKQIELGIGKDVVNNAFIQLGLTEYQQLLDGKRPKVKATEENEALLKALMDKKWISSFEEDKENPEYFQTYGRVMRKRTKVGTEV